MLASSAWIRKQRHYDESLSAWRRAVDADTRSIFGSESWLGLWGRPDAGESWEQVTRELGQHGDTIRRWCTAKVDASSSSRALAPVRVVPDAHVGPALAVVSPAGFRVDGLTLTEAAALLRQLG